MINKVFQFDTKLAADNAEQSIEKILLKWMINHPHYDCVLHRVDKDNGFELIINCNDITHSNSRLN